MEKYYYITTTLPYVNAEPHIGFAAEIVRADVLARYARLSGKEVFFNTGTDEHGLKIFRKAQEENMGAQEYTDKLAARFDDLKKALNLSYNSFIRTTEERHVRAAQEFWKLCEANGDIYRKNYQVKYCVGCESAKTESELTDGFCPLHPGKPLEMIDEENYFFRFSKYREKLLDFYGRNPDFVFPANRQKEIGNFVAAGLEDFSISRLKSKMPWGVPVPGDDSQVMYVWFDALSNYISCLGWPEDKKTFVDFWGTADRRNAVQVAGKDNLRFQTAMWQAMLMSAGLPNSKQVLIFGFITSGGQKMSKSLGNVVNPFDLTDKYGTDAVRHFLLSELKPFEDSDFTAEKFEARYQADLANGIGNLVARSVTLAGKLPDAGIGLEKGSSKLGMVMPEMWEKYRSDLEAYSFDEAVKTVFSIISSMDNLITQTKPWELIRNKDRKAGEIMYEVLESIRHSSVMLWPFIPGTAEEIMKRLGLDPEKELAEGIDGLSQWGRLETDARVGKGEPLFPRLVQE